MVVVSVYIKNKKIRGSDSWSILKRLTREICHSISANKQDNWNKTAKAIKEFIDDNYANQDMSMKLLADRFILAGPLISKIFKEYTGMTFSDYLLELRVKAAIKLLNDPEVNVTAITEAVGYMNYLTFKRAFIRHQGISPKEYKEKLLSGIYSNNS